MLIRRFDLGVARDHSRTRNKFENVNFVFFWSVERTKTKKQYETHLEQHVQHLADSSHPLLHRSLILAHDLFFFILKFMGAVKRDLRAFVQTSGIQPVGTNPKIAFTVPLTAISQRAD